MVNLHFECRINKFPCLRCILKLKTQRGYFRMPRPEESEIRWPSKYLDAVVPHRDGTWETRVSIVTAPLQLSVLYSVLSKTWSEVISQKPGTGTCFLQLRNHPGLGTQKSACTLPPLPKLLFPSLASGAWHCQPLAVGEQCHGLRELCMIARTVASTIFFLIVLRS